MTTEEWTAAAQRYYDLMQQGVSPAEAYRQAFPDGIPTKKDEAKKAGKAQQNAAIAQVGGTIGGAAAGKLAVDAVTGSGWFAKKAAEEAAKKTAEEAGKIATTTTAENAATTAAQNTGANVAEQGGAQIAEQGIQEGANIAPDTASTSYLGPVAAALAAAKIAQAGYEGANKTSKQQHGDDLSAEQIQAEYDPTTQAIGKNRLSEAFRKVNFAKMIKVPGLPQAGAALAALNMINPIFLATQTPGLGTAIKKLGNSLIDNKTLAEDRRKEALATAGYKYLGNTSEYSKDTHKERYKRDEAEREALQEKYGKDFVGYTPEGQFVNMRYHNSHDDKDLMPEDIVGYAGFAERFGNPWMENLTHEQRLGIAQEVLNSGAGRMHHGTYDIQWDKIDPAKLDAYFNGDIGGRIPDTRGQEQGADAQSPLVAALSGGTMSGGPLQVDPSVAAKLTGANSGGTWKPSSGGVDTGGISSNLLPTSPIQGSGAWGNMQTQPGPEMPIQTPNPGSQSLINAAPMATASKTQWGDPSSDPLTQALIAYKMPNGQSQMIDRGTLRRWRMMG